MRCRPPLALTSSPASRPKRAASSSAPWRSAVKVIRPSSVSVLADYYRAVAERTRGFVDGLTPIDLDQVVDKRWNPPVTLGVRLISVADDAIQHSGQANYARGMLARQR